MWSMNIGSDKKVSTEDRPATGSAQANRIPKKFPIATTASRLQAGGDLVIAGRNTCFVADLTGGSK